MIRILEYGKLSNQEIFARVIPQTHVEDIVTEIIRTVRQKGDKALFDYARKFDSAELDCLAVIEAEIEEAFASVDPQFLEVLEAAAKNIRAFHEKQVRNSFIMSAGNGAVTH